MKIVEITSKHTELNDKEIKFSGWVRNHRTGKNVSFLMINDGTCFETVQVVYKNLENQEEIEKTLVGASLEIKGLLKLTEGKNQKFEITATEIKVIGNSSENYPLQPKKHTYEFMREIPHLRTRTNTFNAVFKIRSHLSFAVHQFFASMNFLSVHTPIITSIDAEGAGEMFQVTTLDLENPPKTLENLTDYKEDFFRKKANLTVSGQLLAESYALSFGNVYTFGPTFRAENSNTTRHAAEFWMIEPEMAFADLEDNIELAKNLLMYVVDYVLKKAPKELEFLNNLVEYDLTKRLVDLTNSEFVEIDYSDAVSLLEEAIKSGVKFEKEVKYGIDLATEHERHLTDVKFGAPVFVKNYPKEIKAFYMRLNSDNKTVAAMDLLVPGIGELLGGSQREERTDVLEQLLKVHNLDSEEYDWYMQLRKFGGVKHSGFGIGFERLVMYVTGMENIRDVIPFPRTTKNCEF